MGKSGLGDAGSSLLTGNSSFSTTKEALAELSQSREMVTLDTFRAGKWEDILTLASNNRF